MTSAASLSAIAALLLASSTAAAKPARGLEAECARVTEVYPLVMLARMAEGPMNCGTSDDGSDYVDCHAGETPQERAARERRLAIRKHQEAAYKKASDACDAWQADKERPDVRDALAAAIAEARATDRGALPPETP